MIRALFKGILFIAFLVLLGGASGVTALYLFRGTQGVFLPQVKGLDAVRALELLGERGIPLQVLRWEFSDDVPPNYVVDQLPAGGRRIREGRTVSLVLSRGSRDVLVPNVLGENLNRAETLIRLSGLRVGVIGRLFDPKRPIEQVIGSWPLSREKIPRGESVALLVSQGPRERVYAMPSLIGEPVNSALDRVRQVGLSVGRVRYVDRQGALRGTIVAQVPLPGQRVLAGHRVSVEVARGADQLSGNFAVLRYRVPAGRPERQLRIELESNGAKREALSRKVRAGEEIHFFIPVKGKRTWARIYLDGQLVEEQAH
ncbi:MAG: PASTA domain-containing protein [bacterium]|nr:PASTA domain-containing protein [bacterium]